ncbi:MAG TPA: CCA tRNA nucleotidyltransferase [Candidatus Binatia bacterium]|nr:CCA tRNA nucleotidyltransferase [Candidatus Binatia bacterium]
MPVQIHPVPPRLDLARVLEVLQLSAAELGVDAYLVGGFVRDRLLGKEGKDIDVVVVGSDGVPLLQAVARRLGWARPAVFEHFGTAQVRGGGFVIEVVRARAERYDPESRKPDVRPGTLDDDIRRRDFTVNTLVQTLDGRILDITGRGLDDLRHGVLRTPLDPAETFSEDPLRMFRAARFTAQLGFHLAAGLLASMREMAHRAAILSAERIRDELSLLLVSPHPRRGMEVLRESGLLEVVIPELLPMIGVEQGGWHIYDVWEHTLRAVEKSPADLVTRLGCLFHDAGKPATHALSGDGRHTFYDHPRVGAELAAAVMERLRYSNQEIAQVVSLVLHHMWPIQYRPEEVGDGAVRRFVRTIGELRDRSLAVARADTKASAFPDLDAIDELERRMARLDAEGEISRLRPPLDGHELMRMAERGPGPWVGRAQRALLDAILDGEIPGGDPDAARRWLEDHPDLLGG